MLSMIRIGLWSRYASDIAFANVTHYPFVERPPFIDQEFKVSQFKCQPIRDEIFDEPGEYYTYGNCVISFQRQASFYIYTTIIPSIVVTATAILGLFLPFDTTGKRRV